MAIHLTVAELGAVRHCIGLGINASEKEAMDAAIDQDFDRAARAIANRTEYRKLLGLLRTYGPAELIPHPTGTWTGDIEVIGPARVTIEQSRWQVRITCTDKLDFSNAWIASVGSFGTEEDGIWFGTEAEFEAASRAQSAT